MAPRREVHRSARTIQIWKSWVVGAVGVLLHIKCSAPRLCFGNPDFLYLSVVSSQEDVSYVPGKPQGTCLAHSTYHVAKKRHTDPEFPGWPPVTERDSMLQVWVPTAGRCWVS